MNFLARLNFVLLAQSALTELALLAIQPVGAPLEVSYPGSGAHLSPLQPPGQVFSHSPSMGETPRADLRVHVLLVGLCEREVL